MGRISKRIQTQVFIALLVVALAIAATFGGMYAYGKLRPYTLNVDGTVMQVKQGTTYADLRADGTLNAPAGNLLAVDGSIITEGGGSQPTVYCEDRVVDPDEIVLDNTQVGERAGEDVIEPSTTQVQETPYTIQVNDDGSFNFYNGPLHMAMQAGTTGKTQVVTGSISGKTVSTQVQAVEPRKFMSYTSNLPDDQKVIALTFDDGPNDSSAGTQAVLDSLAAYNVKATFFMLGSQVESYPEMACKVRDAGHQIASHTYSHASSDYLNKLDAQGVRQQIIKSQDVIEQATGVRPHVVRPPGGNMSGDNVKAGGDLVDAFVGWSVGTGDFERPGVDYICNAVIPNVKPGSIVLMHDGGGDRSQTAAALRTIIPTLQAQGYTFVTVDEIIARKKAYIATLPTT